MIRALLLALFLLPRVAFGQSADVPSGAAWPEIKAIEVKVGLGSRLLQVASIAFDPWQRNAHWPMFAYSANAPELEQICEYLHGTAIKGDMAFVYEDSSGQSDEPSLRRFQGVRIDSTSQIGTICDNRNTDTALHTLLGLNSDSTSDGLYFLSERPFRHIESSFRTSIVDDRTFYRGPTEEHE